MYYIEWRLDDPKLQNDWCRALAAGPLVGTGNEWIDTERNRSVDRCYGELEDVLQFSTVEEAQIFQQAHPWLLTTWRGKFHIREVWW